MAAKRGTKRSKEVERLLPMRPVAVHVLLALVEGAEHGYHILKEVEARSAGRVRPGPATLYDTIHRLHRDGLLEESAVPRDVERDDSRRRYYQLTKLGRMVLRAEVERLSDLVGYAGSKGVLPASEESQG